MNLVISLLQLLLGVWNIIGGIYMSTHYLELINDWAYSSFPSFFWIILGVVQIILSLILIVSMAKGSLRKMAPISAIILAIIALFGITSYLSYSGFPGMLWGLIPAVLLLWVAYWRGTRQ